MYTSRLNKHLAFAIDLLIHIFKDILMIQQNIAPNLLHPCKQSYCWDSLLQLLCKYAAFYNNSVICELIWKKLCVHKKFLLFIFLQRWFTLVNNVPGTTKVTALFVHSLKENQPEVLQQIRLICIIIHRRHFNSYSGCSNRAAVYPMDSPQLDIGIPLGLPIAQICLPQSNVSSKRRRALFTILIFLFII